MSLVVTALLIAGGALCGGAAAARRIGRDRSGSMRSGAASALPPSADERGPHGSVGPFVCGLGDVVVARDGREAWLAGVLIFSEEAPVAALFVAPDSGAEHVVYVRPLPSEEVLWLARIEPDALGLEVGREPPSSLEHDRARYERQRRLPLRVSRFGTHAPSIGEESILSEYRASTGNALVIVTWDGGVLALHGRGLGPGMYDVLPAPDTPAR